jgi:hypothetical protein
MTTLALMAPLLVILSAAAAMAQPRDERTPETDLFRSLKTQTRKDIEREIFGAPEKAEKDKFAARSVESGEGLGERLRRQLGPAAEKEDANPLAGVARRMLEVHERVRQSDAGPATLNLQKQIVADLDRLIDEARKSAGQCNSSASAQQQSSSSKPSSSPPKPGAGASHKAGNKPAAGAGQRKEGEQRRKPDMDEMRTIMKDLWGELPPQVREQMLQAPVEQFVPKYEQLIEDYFRDLSDQKEGDGK